MWVKHRSFCLHPNVTAGLSQSNILYSLYGIHYFYLCIFLDTYIYIQMEWLGIIYLKDNIYTVFLIYTWLHRYQKEGKQKSQPSCLQWKLNLDIKYRWIPFSGKDFGPMNCIILGNIFLRIETTLFREVPENSSLYLL